jgi:hypothetical protein
MLLTLPVRPSTVISRWPLPGTAALMPAAITAPALVTATPETWDEGGPGGRFPPACEAESPNDAVCHHAMPSRETKAVSMCPEIPVSTAPSGPEFIRLGVKPAGPVKVAANRHAVPFRDRYTPVAGTPATTAGLTSKYPCAIEAASENSGWAP